MENIWSNDIIGNSVAKTRTPGANLNPHAVTKVAVIIGLSFSLHSLIIGSFREGN